MSVIETNSAGPEASRPRDALGRPLPPGSEGIPRIPDDLELPPAETLAYAQDLLDRGLAFNAHEVLEAAWKNGPDDEKTLWQSLAQLAVGITHVQRNNVKGAITVLRRASGGLALGGDGAVRHRHRRPGRLRRRCWSRTSLQTSRSHRNACHRVWSSVTSGGAELIQVRA